MISIKNNQMDLEQVPQGLKPLKIGDADRYVAARSAIKISEAGDLELRQVLRYAMIKVGLREKNFPADFEKKKGKEKGILAWRSDYFL